MHSEREKKNKTSDNAEKMISIKAKIKVIIVLHLCILKVNTSIF